MPWTFIWEPFDMETEGKESKYVSWEKKGLFPDIWSEAPELRIQDPREEDLEIQATKLQDGATTMKGCVDCMVALYWRNSL